MRRNLHEQIAHAIGLQIVRGDYKEGDLLPTEVALADRYRVSRTAVREAFRILAAKGLTNSRPKIGTRVRLRGQWNILDQDVLSWHLEEPVNETFLKSLFELRLLVEPEAAAMAADRRTERHLRSLAQALALMQRSATQDGMVEGILSFHQAVLDASDNPLVRSLGTLIESVLRLSLSWESRLEKFGVDGVFDEIVMSHAGVLDAIHDRNGPMARELITTIIRMSYSDIQASVDRNRAV
ncbi:FCD domain-containing protein [Chthonobacter rhizosphaerae]|uniref:FCD domain-containing protein n=1 Tax=Chthonobacter rhizosphaerae TaxID=2735553 RepID=UPI0015EE48BD